MGQSSIYYAGLLGGSSHQPSVWWSKYYFDRLKMKQRAAHLEGHSKLFIFIFVKFKQINWKDFCKKNCKKLWKKSNTWNIRHLVDGTIIPPTQHIILKIVGFLQLIQWPLRTFRHKHDKKGREAHWSKWTLIPFLIWRTFDHSRRWEMIKEF